MKELLFENFSLLQQLEATQGQLAIHTVGAACPHLQEVTSITTWCYCFLGYLAILTTNVVTFDQLVYARILIREVTMDRPGWTTTEPSVNRQQSTQQPLGTPSIPACKRQQS